MPAATYVAPRNGKIYPLDNPWALESHAKKDIDGRTRSLWRYRAVFPANIEKPISLGDGCTPLVQQAWGNLRPLLKLEWFNPTGSFKDRGSAVMLSFIRQIGVDAILEDSSGNGGSSIAGLGAAGGMRVKILAPASKSPAKVAQACPYGAEIQLVEGPREECEAEPMRQSNAKFHAGRNWQPMFLEGTKSLAYEPWEDLGFRAPDNVVTPVGAGSNLLGCAFGFRELMKAGQITKLPRLFAAQPLNCSPIDASFTAGVDTPVARDVQITIAEGTAIKQPLRLRGIVGTLRQSRGGAVTLTEAEVILALGRLARQGLFAEPTSASAAAALDKLPGVGSFKRTKTTVVLLTGNGLKSRGYRHQPGAIRGDPR